MLIFALPYLLMMFRAEAKSNSSTCDNFQANFSTREMTGSWYTVAIIPEKMFPDNNHRIACYKVDFSETDPAGLGWLANNTVVKSSKVDPLRNIKGAVIRQRYHSGRPFDVWSKSIEGVNGCFKQVLSLDTDKNELSHAITHNDMMQIHIMDTNDNAGPFLLQMLWGRMISVVIYRRQEGITQDDLKPVYEFVNKLRGPQRTPRICEPTVRDVFKQI